MPRPTHSQVHVDRVLSSMSVAYMQENGLYAASKFLSQVPVKRQSDSYFKFDKGDFFRDEAQLRAPGAPAAEVGFGLSTGTYNCVRYAAKYKLPWEIRDNAEDPQQLERAAVEKITQTLLIKRERLFASAMLGTSLWSSDQTGVASNPSTDQFVCWDVSGSTPRKNLRDQAMALQKSIGRRPNKLFLGQKSYEALAIHSDFVNLIATDTSRLVTPQFIAQALDIEEVVIGGATYNTAAQGATASMSFIADDVALMAYVAPSASLMTPSAAYEFSWTAYDGISPRGAAIKRWSDDDLESDIMVGEIYVAMHLTASDCGVYFTNTCNA